MHSEKITLIKRSVQTKVKVNKSGPVTHTPSSSWLSSETEGFSRGLDAQKLHVQLQGKPTGSATGVWIYFLSSFPWSQQNVDKSCLQVFLNIFALHTGPENRFVWFLESALAFILNLSPAPNRTRSRTSWGSSTSTTFFGRVFSPHPC